jgi:MFS family permease
MVVSESLGAKRLGAVLGLQAFFTTLGFAAGPIIAGRIFDVSGSYAAALVLFAAMALISCLAMRATRPLAEERARFEVDHSAAA